MTNTQETSNSELFVPVMLAALFILFVVVLVWITQIKPITDQGFAALPIVAASEAEASDTTAAPAAPAAPAEAPAEPGAPGDMDAVIAAINKAGCVACHTIPGIPDAVGQVGPNLSNIGVDAATRREGYTAEEYIHESLASPNAFTAPKCPFGPCVTGMMPNLPLNDSEINVVVSYLVTLGK